MSVYIDVWHRSHPLTPAVHRRFLDYYGKFVVAPPSDYFEVVAGFRYTDGATNEDFALYRYESMARIEESMMSFGADEEYQAASEALFAEIEIEETRGIALHTPYSPESRIDQALAESTDLDSSRRFVRIVRTCSGTARPRAFEVLGRLMEQVEAEGHGRLLAGLHYLVGPVMDLVEIWVLPPDRSALPVAPGGVDSSLLEVVAELAPERERRGLSPTEFSKIR